MTDLLVMKFGGTSVGSAERIRVAAGLAAAERARRPVVVVVSAMSKITDLLLGTMRHAEAGDRAGMDANMAALRARHEEACRALLPEPRRSAVLDRVRELIGEFERIVGGMAMLNERPPRSVDEAVAVGERLSALLVSEYLVPGRSLRRRECLGRDGNRRRVRQRQPADGTTREKARARVLPLIEAGRLAGGHGLQRGDRRRAAHHARPRRFGFFGVHSGGRAGRRGACGSGPTWMAS